MKFIDPQQAFREAIAERRLSEDRAAAYFVGHFMYMGTNDEGVHLFKHSTTREYLPAQRQTYQHRIRTIVGSAVDPRHVEAYMRLEHHTLDSLSKDDFEYEAKASATCVLMGGEVAAEQLAKSFGL